jgi:hypothetical protein
MSSLSFAHFKAKLSFNFIFKNLKKRVFYALIPVLRLIMSDQAIKMWSLMPITLLNAIL